MSEYDLSIIIPVYNCEKSIEKCIESILNQEKNLIEIVIINDGSTDKTIEKCKQLKNQHKNIKIINQENKGVSYTRNIGIKEAKGKYIMFVDADDYLEGQSLEEVRDLMSKNVDVLRYSYNIKGKNTNAKVIFKNEIFNLLEDKTSFFEYFFQQKNQNMVWGQVIKKELLEDVRFYNNIFFGEDLLFNCQLYKKCKYIKYTNTVLYNYRQSEGSVTRDYTNSKVKDKIKNLIYVFEKIILEYKDELLIKKIQNKFLDEIVPQIMMLTFDRKTNKKEVILQLNEILENKFLKEVLKNINENELTMCKYKHIYRYMKNKEIKKIYRNALMYRSLKFIQQLMKSIF